MCICDNLPQTKIRLRSLRKLYPEATELNVLHREVVDGRLIALVEGVIEGHKFSHVFCPGDVYWHLTHLKGRDGVARVARVGHDTYNCARKNAFAQKTQEAVARKLSLVLTAKGMVMALFGAVAQGGYVGQRPGPLYIKDIQDIIMRIGIEHDEVLHAIDVLVGECIIGRIGVVLTHPPLPDISDDTRVKMESDNPMLVFSVSGNGFLLQIQRRYAYGEATVCMFDEGGWLCTCKRVHLLYGGEYGLAIEDIARFEEMFMDYLEMGSLEMPAKGT